MRQASYACGKTARQKNLAAIHAVRRAQKAGSTPDLDVVQVLENLRVTPGERANTAAVKGAHDWATIEDQEDVAEAMGLDGVEEMTEYLNEMCNEEMEKNVSGDEKEEGEDYFGGTRGATTLCGTLVPLPSL